MPPRKKEALAQPPSSLEIGSLFEQELQSLNENLRRQAAQSMFKKLQPSNKYTVEQFLSLLKEHKEVWMTVSKMGIVDFADAINDGQRLREAHRRPEFLRTDGKRTRLNEGQKQALKQLVLRVLGDRKEGLNRNELADGITPDQIAGLGVDRSELANKLRQPLAELVHDNRIHTVGEKRLMKYHIGQGATPAPAAKKKGRE
jgi:hypothetical protein